LTLLSNEIDSFSIKPLYFFAIYKESIHKALGFYTRPRANTQIGAHGFDAESPAQFPKAYLHTSRGIERG
jgi:hypothetical protein